jgi:uncharacterized membrane protein required for colicin V production
MNILDLIVIGIMGLCIFFGVWRGFIRTALGFANFILAIFLTNLLYPHMGRFLRGAGGLFDSLKTSIGRALNLEAILEQRLGDSYYNIINDLPLPSSLRNTLIENYPYETVHAAIGAVGIGDYIAGFLAGIVINIISLIITFVLIFIGLIILTRLLNIISKLPVLNTLNKLLGAVMGAFLGLLLTWLVLGVIVIYFAASGSDMVGMLEGSAIARPIHNANPIVNFILRFFP